jgi:hypothetical protein
VLADLEPQFPATSQYIGPEDYFLGVSLEGFLDGTEGVVDLAAQGLRLGETRENIGDGHSYSGFAQAGHPLADQRNAFVRAAELSPH